MLLIEANLDARDRHEEALRAAGYDVRAITACPDNAELSRASLVLSDVPSFHWLREQSNRRLPPTIVLSYLGRVAPRKKTPPQPSLEFGINGR